MITVPALGAPYEASWNDFLRQHKLQYALAGAAARVLGLFPAANLLVLLAAVLAALSFFAVSRHAGARLEWALAGSLAFALSPFFFYRSLTHLTLANDWPIPLAILVVSWAFGRRGVVPGTRRFWVAAPIAIVAGLHNIYFAALFAQFLGLAFLAQWLLRRSLARRARYARDPGAAPGRGARRQREPPAPAREPGADPRVRAGLTATSSATRSSRSSSWFRSGERLDRARGARRA